ncbi:MAG TPA: hypothetical protein DHV28_17665 [Ignavibacteriales bacterium]|nr:hypothetical protein [Ignavibacteriales bacterium]
MKSAEKQNSDVKIQLHKTALQQKSQNLNEQIATHKKRRLTRRAMLKAIDNSYGNISFIADLLGVARSTVYTNIEKFELQELLDSERERLIDFAENQLVTNIAAGKEVSIIFFLKTRAKNRGYVEKTEIDYRDQTPVFIENLTE